MKSIKIKNKDLDVLVDATSIKLTFERSRARNQFIKVLQPYLELFDKNKSELILSLCEKEDGKPKMTEDNKFIFKNKKIDIEYPKLLDEEVAIDVTPSLKKVLPEIVSIIKKSDKEWTAAESLSLERIIEAIESVK